MAPIEHNPPTNPSDWVVICDRELANISGAYRGQLSNDAKVDHALRATEAILKAIIWKREGWESWPKIRKGVKYLYNHDLAAMLDKTGLRTRLRLSDEHWASWRTLENAIVKQHRYSPTAPSDDEANAVARSTRDLDIGVVPWLRERYREID